MVNPNVLLRVRCAAILSLLLAVFVSVASAQSIPMPAPEKMNRGVDPAKLQQLEQATRVLERNPKDVTALVTRDAMVGVAKVLL